MAAPTLYCGNCGAQNVQGESFCPACGYALAVSSAALTSRSAPTGQLQAQELLRGRYRVLRMVGKGGMGAVYQAQDTQLGDRTVAVKEMSQGNLYGQQTQSAIESFKREAHLLAGLQHPNLPSIHDYFEEGGHWYLVMSFIQGESLADYLQHAPQGKLPLEEALVIAQELCNVLHYLHSHQPPIIFRDLKPSNIMRTTDGHIYLIDFGIARHFKPGQTRDTASYGSMGYSPPEQYGRAQTTERSDIYSLGATLYQCLSGYEPSSSPFRLPSLQTLVPTLPDQLVRLITQMLELDENMRPGSIKQVQQELQVIAREPQQRYAPPPPPGASVPPTRYALPSIQYSDTLPPIQYPVNPPALGSSRQVMDFAGTLARPQPRNTALWVIGRIFSVIGILIGLFFAFVGALGTVLGGPVAFINVSYGTMFILFGLLIIFISTIRKSTFPLAPARRFKATLGLCLGIFGVLFGIVVCAIGLGSYGSPEIFNAGIGGGIVSAAAGVLIWLVTRVWAKNRQS